MNGDHAAFNEVFNELKDGIYYFSLSYLRNSSDAQEIVQEVFIRLWEHRKRIDTTKNITAYVYMIARNYILDTIRSKEFRSKFQNTENFVVSSNVVPADDEIVYYEYMDVLFKAIETLPPRSREIYCLSRDKNLSYRQIATQTGISVKMVEKHISKALAHIREQLLHYAELSIPFLLLYYFFSS